MNVLTNSDIITIKSYGINSLQEFIHLAVSHKLDNYPDLYAIWIKYTFAVRFT